jgi:hypothetical protein
MIVGYASKFEPNLKWTKEYEKTKIVTHEVNLSHTSLAKY